MLSAGETNMKTPTFAVIFLLLLLCAASTQAQEKSKGPLVLINGNGNVTVTGGTAGNHGLAVGGATTSKHDQTMEMAAQILKHCPEITITVKSDATVDYQLLLNRESSGPLGGGISQIMLLRGSDLTVLYVTSNGTVARTVRAGCKAILDDWKQTHSSTSSSGPWNFTKPATPAKSADSK